MAGKNDSAGEKTEQPTEKRLREARREGNVARSNDLSHTVTTVVWTLLLLGFSGYAATRVSALLEHVWTKVDLSSPNVLGEVGWMAARTLMELTLIPIAIVAFVGVIVEFLQTGGLFAPKKITPKLEHVNPISGFQRMFSPDNLFEIGKSVLKTLVLAVLIAVVVRQYLPDILKLPEAGIAAYTGFDRRMILTLCTYVVVVFAFVSVADRLYQNYSYRKNLRMSKDEVRRERKEEHGDPHLRSQRRRLRKQFATQNVRQAAREATALIVNPTHIAVAILYDPEQTAIPVITAKAEGDLAKLMRQEAEDAGVPVIRDVPLARALNYLGEEDDFIPEEYFDAVAEIIAFAEKERAARKPPAQ